MRAGARAFPDGAYPREIRVWIGEGSGQKAVVHGSSAAGSALDKEAVPYCDGPAIVDRPIPMFVVVPSVRFFSFSWRPGRSLAQTHARTGALERGEVLAPSAAVVAARQGRVRAPRRRASRQAGHAMIPSTF